MKKIFDGDSMVKTIMGAKKVKPGCVYRWSCFTVPYTHNDRRYIFNNFSKVCFDVEPDELDLRTDARFTSEQAVADENLSALVSDLFLVPEDEDEAVSYEKYSAMFRAMRTNKKGYSSYTILPTTACNARCFYCFEEGMKFVTMSDETVSQTIEFIKKTRNPGNPVNFAWFGGEPLAGERIIDSSSPQFILCEQGRPRKCPWPQRVPRLLRYTFNPITNHSKNEKRLEPRRYSNHA